MARLERRESDDGRRMRIVYLFTTFPLLSETPCQRELQVLKEFPVELEIYSLWGGGVEFEGLPIRCFDKWRVMTLLWLLPLWVARKPRGFLDTASRLFRTKPPSPLNVGETLLGLAFALCYAGRFSQASERPDLFHAAWATLPATAAQLLSELTRIPFSMGAHAYDVFRHGGDWDLVNKLESAVLVVTSTDFTRRHLLERGSAATKTVLVRRGLNVMPPRRSPRADRVPMRILSIGRLIEKKGYDDQLTIYAALRSAGLSFEVRIVGSGPLRRTLGGRIADLGLSEFVTLLGALPFDAVREHYAWADVLLFTGKVARSGDRDGLPNVVPEAMASGVPVVARAAAGVAEAIEDGCTGVLITRSGIVPWLSALKRLQRDGRHYETLCAGARAWVEEHYDARKNVHALFEHFQTVIASSTSASRPLSRQPRLPPETGTGSSWMPHAR